MSEDLALFGHDLFGDPNDPFTGALAERFVMPPFSVLNARSGEWQARKEAWLSIGIQSELGRGAVQASMESLRKLLGDKKAAPGGSPMPAMDYSDGQRGDGRGRKIFSKDNHIEVSDKKANRRASAITMNMNHIPKKNEGEKVDWLVSSIFDPVLCELAYKWWCPPGGQVLDPFSGGSVRGIVAGILGRPYWGCDLREEQIEANRQQLLEMEMVRPTWVAGDSRDTLKDAPESDFILSCPPYGDLEVYSEDPADISNMSWKEFTVAYKEIIRKSCEKLKNNRFACWVIGEFRDKQTGCYRNFVGGTIKAFKQSGLELYNEAILVTAVGTASVRATKQFQAGRKLVKTHQNILVFLKGDWREAMKALKEGS